VLATVIAALAIPTASAGARTPTDPMAAAEQPLQIMRVPTALDLAGPLADVRVATIDTGIDLEHPDLAPRIDPPGAGSDLIGNPPPCTKAPGAEAPDDVPDDPAGCGGHGTLVAGVLGATWDNGIGGAGVAPNARFVPLRACWDDSLCYQYNDAEAVDRAAAAGARVISFSELVGPIEPDFQTAIADNPQLLFVAIPGGNGGAYDADGDDPMPCNLPLANVLCVSTSSPTDGLDCGPYGPAVVDVAVPTQNGVTTTNGGGFLSPTGCATSFAAPTAAGVAAILFGAAPGASGAQIKNAILAGARPVPDWQGKSVTGGILDAVGAVAVLNLPRSTVPASAPVTPAPGIAKRCKRKHKRSAVGAKRKCKRRKKRR
jgi:subtilisin family serine protease